MDTKELLAMLNAGKVVAAGSQAHREMIRISNEAMMLTAQLNGAYHTPGGGPGDLLPDHRRGGGRELWPVPTVLYGLWPEHPCG